MFPLRNTPLLRLALCFALGIGVADVLQRYSLTIPSFIFILLSFTFLLLAVGIEWNSRRIRQRQALQPRRVFLFRVPLVNSVLLLLSVAAFGAWRYNNVRDDVVASWPEGPVDCRVIVRGDPVPRQRSVRYTLDVAGHRVYGYCFGSKASNTYVWGDTLLLRGVVVRPPENFTDSLTFDYARSLYCRRISGTVMIPASKVTLQPFVPREGVTWPGIMGLRRKVVVWIKTQFVEAGVPDDVLGVVEALSLGDKSRMSDDVRDAFSDAGASHLLALSGLHVGVLYSLLTLTLGLLLRGRTGKRLCSLLAVLLLWAFALLTGLSPSLVRAVTMFTVYAIVLCLSGDRSPLSALALTALVMLGIQPFNLFNVGFQLSFASMLAILTVMPQMETLFLRIPLLSTSRLLSAPFTVAVISIAAQVGVAPLVLHYFGCFPTYFLVTNIVVLPFIYAVMVLLVVWLVLSLVLPCLSLAPLFGNILTPVVHLMNALLSSIAGWPGSTLHVAHFTFLDAILLWALFYFLLRYLIKKHTPSAVWALICVVALLVCGLVS